jgi:alcohol dehydrogenase class IV
VIRAGDEEFAAAKEPQHMQFEFATASRIIFGRKTVHQVASLAAGMGRRWCVVTGASPKRAAELLDQLRQRGLEITALTVSGEPTTDSALEAVSKARDAGCEAVVAIGGGSVLDTGKVIAALLTNRGELMQYLEVIGKGQSLSNPSAPCIAVPTTAGTGAEVTRNAVLGSPHHRVKVSMRSAYMLPALAVVDPELTYSMPPAVTASTGLDAFTQLLEAFLSNQSNPVTDALCREGLQRAVRSLALVYEDGTNQQGREDMALASLFGGIVLANAKLGAVHGIAGPLGGMYPASHGMVCASLLPHVMEANLAALRRRMPQSPALERFTEIARIMTGKTQTKAQDGVDWIHRLCRHMRVPALESLGVAKADLPTIVEKSKNASSMKGNPVQLTESELLDVLYRSL